MSEHDTATVTLLLDGRPIQARPGEMIIAAAEREGTYIPRFCYHPRMKPVGMCRMCLVDVKGPRGFSLQPACFVEVSDGQEVVTDSPSVKKAQDGVLEFLLVNHPLDCPVCDKGGECPLQDQTLAYGPGESRFIEEKRHFEKPIAISDLVYLDRERCIQCARCTRFALEVAGDPLIDFQSRGDRVEVNTFPDRPFASYFSGNTVQICPVGALTATPYRFRARPWDLDQVESTCTSCSVGCRVVVQSSENRLTRYLGVDSEPVNHSWLCDKGRFDFEAITSESRISQPMLRSGDSLVEVPWGEALDAAATALRGALGSAGPSSVGIVGGARLTNEDAYAWTKLAKSVLATDSVDAQLGDGLPAELVLSLPRATIDQACSARVVVLMGPDLREELPVLFLRLREAVIEGGPDVVEVSAVPTSMTPYASVSVRHAPGRVDAAASALVEPDGSAEGVDPGQLAAARRVLGDGSDVVVLLGRPSLAESPAPAAAAATTLATSLPSARFLPVLRRANVNGALDMGMSPGLLPGRVGLEEARQWFSAAWGRAVPSERGMDTAAMLRAAAAGRLSVLVLLGADPLSDFPDRALAVQAVEKVGTLVVVDGFLDGTADHADIVLPPTLYAESAGTTTNIEGRVSRLGHKVVPPGVAWPEWMVAAELASRLGADLGFTSLEGIWEEVQRLAPAYAGLTVDVLNLDIARDGVVVPLHATPVTIGALAPIDPIATPGIDSVERQGMIAASGTAEPVGADANGATNDTGSTDAARPPLLSVTRSAAAPPGAGPAAAPPRTRSTARPAGGSAAPPAGWLALVAPRRLYDRGTLVSHCPSLAHLDGAAVARVHPTALAAARITAGDYAKLVSDRGELVVGVELDDEVPPGVVVLPFNLAGAPVSTLIDAASAVAYVRLEAGHG